VDLFPQVESWENPLQVRKIAIFETPSAFLLKINIINSILQVIQCLKRLSRKQNISIITSIHQPNNAILMMFDKLYVLAKGGFSVYSGRPQDLNKHLTNCGIKCTQFQHPIEVLLKYTCTGIEDKQVLELNEKTSQEKQVILERCNEETKLFPDGLIVKSKRFKLIDFWILLSRTITYTYRYKWKLLLIQFFIYLLLAFSLTSFFRSDIGKASGCISFEEDFNTTCNKTIEKLEEEELLTQNIKYNYFVVVNALLVQLISTCATFTSEVNLFLHEHRNGKSIEII
jgi:hypothetical protein